MKRLLALLAFHAKLAALAGFFVLNDSGADGDGDTGGAAGGGNSGGPSAGQIAAAEARAAAKAKTDAEQAIAEQLGVPVAEAKAILDRQRAAEEATLTDAQLKAKQAEEALARATEAETAANQIRHEAAVTAALVASGIADDAAELVPLVKVDEGATPDVIAAAVTDLKKRRPGLFATAGSPASHDTSANGAGNQGGGSTQTAKERAAAAFAQRRNTTGLQVVRPAGQNEPDNITA